MMSTGFSFSITSQSAMFFEDVRISAIDTLFDFSMKHPNIARCTGLPIALCFSLLDLAQAVSTVGESLIKGIANIFGVPFSKQCSFLKGVQQLCLQFPLHLIKGAIGCPLGIAYEILITPIGMLISPLDVLKFKKEYAEERKKALEKRETEPPVLPKAQQQQDLARAAR